MNVSGGKIPIAACMNCQVEDTCTVVIALMLALFAHKNHAYPTKKLEAISESLLQ